MMKLNKSAPAFEVTTGPFAGHRFEHGVVYRDDQVPEKHKGKFSPVTPSRKKTAKKTDEEASDK